MKRSGFSNKIGNAYSPIPVSFYYRHTNKKTDESKVINGALNAIVRQQKSMNNVYLSSLKIVY